MFSSNDLEMQWGTKEGKSSWSFPTDINLDTKNKRVKEMEEQNMEFGKTANEILWPLFFGVSWSTLFGTLFPNFMSPEIVRGKIQPP